MTTAEITTAKMKFYLVEEIEFWWGGNKNLVGGSPLGENFTRWGE